MKISLVPFYLARVPSFIHMAHFLQVISGSFHQAGSYQAYMEPHASVVTPRDGGRELDIVGTSQHVARMIDHVATLVGKDRSQVTGSVRRLGGGFGGKGSPILALPALATVRTGKPCKQTLTRFHDMLVVAKRGEMNATWSVVVGEDGRIAALKVEIAYLAGYYRNGIDYIPQIAFRNGMTSYEIPNLHCSVRLLKTNRSPTGPFRGAGIPQGATILESIMERTAKALGTRKNPFHLALLVNVFSNFFHFSGVDGDEFRRKHMRRTAYWLG